MNKVISLLNIKRLLEYRSLTTKLTADGKQVPKKKEYENRITLINTDNSVSITDLKNAENLSQRRDLKLVKIQDVMKTRRPVYKLMTNVQYHEEELNKRKEKRTTLQDKFIKGEKLLSLSSRIGNHDLMTSVNKIVKFLEKKYEVRIILSGEGNGEMQKAERIYSVIEANVKSMGRIVNKQNKGNSLRFQLQPLNESSSEESGSPHSNPSSNDKGPL